MAIAPGHKANFASLQRAFKAGHVCLLEVTEEATGEKKTALCAVNQDNGEYEFVPMAIMVDGNPYELYLPPEMDDAAPVVAG